MLGEITMFAGTTPPKGWALCNGQVLDVEMFPSLFNIIGNKYGGDGVKTFALPDLRGRGPIHAGQGAGLSNYQIGDTGGEEKVTLNLSEIPPHNHKLGIVAAQGTTNDPTNSLLGNTGAFDHEFSNNPIPDANMDDDAISITGGGQAHENRSPYLTVNFIINFCDC